MTLGANQPYFLPYLGYFQLINAVDKFLIADDFQYIRHGWINRNRILRDGKTIYLTIPVNHPTPNKRINQLFISDDLIECRKLIVNSYNRSPEFERVFPVVNSIIEFSNHNLSKFTLNSIQTICNYLDITTPICLNSSRNDITALKGEEKAIHICISMGADIYINAIGGMSLYSRENFAKEGVELKFLKSELPRYKQTRTQEFVPALSILDIMMNVPRDEVCDMLGCYRLI